MMRNLKKLSLAAVVMFGGAMTASAQRGGGQTGGRPGGQPSGGGGRPAQMQSAPRVQQSAPRIQTTPSFQQSMPRITQSAPSIQQSAPRIQQAMPSIQQSAPRITQSTPSIQQSIPQQSSPRISQSIPSIQQQSPRISQSTPSIQQPNVASSVPFSSPRAQQLPFNQQAVGRTSNYNPTQLPDARAGATASNTYRYQNSPYGGNGANSGAPVYSRIGPGTSVNNTVNNYYGNSGYYGGYRGYGYGGYGYGGYGYGGYGYGSSYAIGLGYGGLSFGYGSGPFRFAITIPLFGGGYGGYGYGGYGSGYVYSQPGYYSYYPTTVVESVPLAQPNSVVPDQVAQQPRPAQQEPADYFTNGQRYLMEGKYPEAIQALRHAAVDMPKNGSVAAVMSQALFANGSFDEAAGAAQQALTLLPENKWVFTLTNTGTMVDTKNSMAELRKQIAANPKEPGLRFLAGYQSFVAKDYKQSVAELDELNKLAPDEPIATKLRKNALELIK